MFAYIFLVFLFTFEETKVINWSWVDILISHLVFIPAVESHIFLPLFEPVSVHQIPTEWTKHVMSVPARRGKQKFKCEAITLKWWHRADSCNSSRGVSADLTLRCFWSDQLAPWFWQVFSFRVRPARVMEPQTGKLHKASPGLASQLANPTPAANDTKKPRRVPTGNVLIGNWWSTTSSLSYTFTEGTIKFIRKRVEQKESFSWVTNSAPLAQRAGTHEVDRLPLSLSRS